MHANMKKLFRIWYRVALDGTNPSLCSHHYICHFFADWMAAASFAHEEWCNGMCVIKIELAEEVV